MSLDKEKIKYVAKLARISVNETKIDSLTKDLNSIFKFIEQLNELNTDKVEPLTSILNQSLRKRKDELLDIINDLDLNVGEYQSKNKKDIANKILSTI